MALSAPLLTRQRIFAAALETTTGDAISLSNTHGEFNAHDHELNIDIPMNERPGQSSLSRLPSVHGARSATMSFMTHLVGNGGSGLPYWAETLLPCCGFVANGSTYAPVTGSATANTGTMGFFEDGRLRAIAGAMGTFTMNMTNGNPVPISWEFMGKLITPTAEALITPTYPTTIPPRFASATMTIASTSYKISELVLTINNELKMREDATDATGYHACAIVNRNITITIDPEALALGTKNWYTDWLAHTEAAFSIVINGGSNNTITISIPKAQLTNVQTGDRDGLMTDQLEFQANRNAAAGDDELTIAFS